MKRAAFSFYLLFAALLSVLFFGTAQTVPVAADGLTEYAQIPEGGAVFYAKSQGDYQPLATLPATYFVAITGTETADGYLPAGYLDLDGYVKAGSVHAVDFEPKYKYAETAPLTLINDGNTVNLRARPDHAAANVLVKIPESVQLHYYGAVSGTAQVAAIGNLWYYVRYAAAGETKYGYIYSLYALPAPIADNVIEAAMPAGSEPIAGGETENADPFRPGGAATVIIIACMSIPAVLMMFVLYRRTTPNKKTRYKE